MLNSKVTKTTINKTRGLKIQTEKRERKKPNYFERIKKINHSTFHFEKPRTNFYYDSETFEYYEDKEDPKELPKIIPYLIGFCTDEPNSYTYFLGFDSSVNFFEYIINRPEAFSARLNAFNIDYDFHAIRPFIIDAFHDQIRIHYHMTDSKKFIYGEITNRERATQKNSKQTTNIVKPINIKMRDLWRWDTQKSLKEYIKHICELTYEKDGTPKQGDFFATHLIEKLDAWAFTLDTFKKLEIDAKKVNLHNVGGRWFYWRSKEDWINNKEPIELDLEHELKYLKIDVTSLPIINYEQQLFREHTMEVLGINKPLDVDRSITIPGYAKWLCEEYEQKYMTETYRTCVPKDVYKLMCDSYTGAFVAGNSNIQYIDEEIFKKLYPKESFYDLNNTPKIKSYDVNSMYPWAMSLGLPYGKILSFRPHGKVVEWYEIKFNEYIDPTNKQSYKWKEKYEYLNNTFFGRNFDRMINPGTTGVNKVFVLKELYELFISMCYVHCEVVAVRYQRVSEDLKDFINLLYKIKRNDGDKYPRSTVKAIKLLLNALYGKMAEKFKERKIEWAIDTDTFIQKHPELLESLDKLGITVIDEEVIKKQKFKSKVSPYLDLKNDCGFFVVENKQKRFNALGEDCRESITAGMFITSISRWKLLSTIKKEIDQGNVVLYSDTDSIKLITIKQPKFLTSKHREKDLGEWKYEGSFTHFGHCNKHKKYFMHDAHSNSWMVKTSGISDKHIRTPENEFDLEMIKTIYNADNRVLVKNSKKSNARNNLYQTVIRFSDFKFTYLNLKDKDTHILENNILRKINE